MNMKADNKRVILITIGVVALLAGIFGATYAYFSAEIINPNGSSMEITTANLGTVYFTDGPEILLEDMYPGTTETKEFTIERAETTLSDEVFYNILLNVRSNTLTPAAAGEFVYSLSGTTNGDGALVDINDLEVPTETTIIGSGSLIGNELHTYTFEITLNETGGNQNATRGMGFNGYLQIELDEEYKETLLNGAYPRITGGMIPITIDNNGVVTTVDPTTSAWYSYENKQWANVVLVKETGNQTRSYYQNNYGVTIDESDILAYLVWIPRYRYTLWNVAGTASTYTGGCSNTAYYSQSTCEANAGTWTTPTCSANCPQTISITFENSNTTKSTGTTNGTQLTHPAFTYDGKELNGIWVGKFETTPIDGSVCAVTPNAGNCLSVNPTIKPNLGSLRYQTVSTQFNTSLIFSSNSSYGLHGESRMSKNSDWGAIVYLSHSIYGINSEIRINNYSGAYTKTGCGASADDLAQSTTCDITYGGASLYPQSTTGNISGIFDISGGAGEYQMGSYSDGTSDKYSGRCNAFNSGYKGLYGNKDYAGCDGVTTSNTTGLDYPNSKYYKLYLSTNWQSNTNYLGEAFGEIKGWYKDSSYIVAASAPWSYRGGYYSLGIISGGFFLTNYTGQISSVLTFRTIATTR